MLSRMIGRVYDLIIVEQPKKLASIAEATLEDAAVRERPSVLMVAEAEPADTRGGVAHRGRSTETAVTVPWVCPSSSGRGRRNCRRRAQAHARTGPEGEELARTLEPAA